MGKICTRSGKGFLHTLAALPLLVAIGTASDVRAQTLIDVGAEWRFLRGTAEPTPDPNLAPTLDWTRVGFDDGTWEVGPTGIGFGDDDDATILEDMRNNYVSV